MPSDPPTKPEDHELDLKLTELKGLESELADRETELATLLAGIHAFEQKSKSMLEPRYAELAEVRARITDVMAQLAPPKPSAKTGPQAKPVHKPRSPRPRTKPSAPAKPAEPLPAERPKTTVFDPGTLKQLYRDVAKNIHPDLADDEHEREHRHALMIRANEAYEAGDGERLHAILHDWHVSPEAIKGQGTVPNLIRAIRRIHRCRRRLAEIAVELNNLAATGFFGLKSMAEAADEYHRDLLDEMANRLDMDITAAKEQLELLESRLPPETPPSDDSPDEPPPVTAPST